ncbi:MAG: HDOD domain-containing protein [Desulfobacteraceae bacterium]|nr:MAG: HDOD domain-containing protein [Desulfobacteraceae bacterium]
MELKKKIVDIIRGKNTNLTTLPVIVEKILSLAQSERTSAQDLALVIEKDQAIAGKLLKLANSAYYGFMKEIDTIPRAITIVGFNEVIGLTIGMNVFSSFMEKDAHGILDLKQLWLHSIACATAAREIARRKSVGNVEKVFLSALLHDMGKIVFAKYLPEEYGSVYKEALNSGVSLYKEEKERLGIDHSELSGLMMKRWNFPEELRVPCRYHHSSNQCPPNAQRFASILELADYLCIKAKMGQIGNGSGSGSLPSLEDIQKRLHLSSKEIDFIVDDLKAQRSNIEEFLEVFS